MSIWRTKHKNGDQSEYISDIIVKPNIKIDTTSKLQVIQALNGGQSEADLAKEYGVHPRIIAQINKQKDSIVKKYAEKYNLLQQVCNLNLEQNLLGWFEQQLKIGNFISEDQLRDRALEILKPLNEEFTCIDDWLFSFQLRHNISKYTADDMCDSKSKEEWKRFLNSTTRKDVYIGGVCALSYDFDLVSYLNGQNADSFVSLLFIVNILGADKKEIAVVGKELLDSEAHIRSLPVKYYYCVDSQINLSVIISYLTKWDSELLLVGKFITLVLNIPECMIKNLQFGNIKIVSTKDIQYIKIKLDKIAECFKYHYRRIQISRSITYGKDNSTFLDYIHMIANAWYNVPHKYIQSLSIPSDEGSLYFNVKDNGDNDHSITHWCKTYNVPLNMEHCPSSLDKFINCDTKLPCLYNGPLDESMQAIDILNQKNCQSTSGMEAYQAMKRLISYMQGESAGGSIMKYAKYLENHIEYGALLQMHQIIGSTNDSI